MFNTLLVKAAHFSASSASAHKLRKNCIVEKEEYMHCVKSSVCFVSPLNKAPVVSAGNENSAAVGQQPLQ